jgi:hypothetical protein
MSLKSLLSALFSLSLLAGVAGAGNPASEQWRAAHLLVDLDDATTISLRRTSLEARPEGWTWRGKVAETGEPAIAMWWKDGRFGGVVAYRGDMYALLTATRIGAEVHARAQRNSQQLAAQHPAMHARDHLGGHAEPAAYAPSAARPVIPSISPAQRQALAAKDVTIDVMVLYTSRIEGYYLDVRTDLIAHAIAEANDSFVNSGIGNVRLNLVHTEEIAYDETGGEHFDHLYRMVDGVGPFANVRALRNANRADVVVLIVDDASSCGLATRVSADAEEAFAVVHHACAAVAYSVPHEIGHIMGASHDLAMDDGEAPFAYGHGYVHGIKWRDIMSYKASCNGCPRVALWSNPTITIDGEPAGTAQADNARVILEQAQRVANFR